MTAVNAARDEIRRPTDWKGDAMRRRIASRYASERRFRALGLFAVLLSAGFLAFLLVSMMANGLRGFTQTELKLSVDFPRTDLMLDPASDLLRYMETPTQKR